MRNVILIAVSVFVIVVAGCGCVLWFIQASQIKQNVENIIANLNAKQPYITYESIQTSGFPSDVIVSIVKPHFSGRIDTLLQQMVPPPTKAQPVTPLPEWSEDWTLDGTISIGINALSDHYTLGVGGNWHSTSKIGGQSFALESHSTGNTACVLQMQHGSGFFDKFWNFKALMNNSNPAQDFRMLDCAFPAYTASDPTTQQVAVSSGGGRLYITNAPQGNTRQVRFYVKSADAEVTPAGDTIVAAYIHAMAPDYPLMVQLSGYGKQNVEMDLAYDGPATMQGDIKTLPLDINLSKFTLSSQQGDAQATLHLHHAITGDAQDAKVTFNITSQSKDQNNTMLQNVARQAIAKMYDPHNPQYAQLQPFTSTHKQEDVYAAVSPVIPNFYALGKITESIDLSYQGSVSNAMNGDINLANLELSATPYGITGKGTAKLTQGNPIPTANLMLGCTNCLHMIDDGANYMQRLERAIALFNPAQAANMQVNPAVVQALKGFLTALAAPTADQSTFSYTIISDGTPNITINGKPMAEVMGLYNQYLAPVLQKQPAPGNIAH